MQYDLTGISTVLYIDIAYFMGHEPNVMATSVGHKTHSANFHKGCNVLHVVCVLEEQICYNRGCLIEILLAYN